MTDNFHELASIILLCRFLRRFKEQLASLKLENPVFGDSKYGLCFVYHFTSPFYEKKLRTKHLGGLSDC